MLDDVGEHLDTHSKLFPSSYFGGVNTISTIKPDILDGWEARYDDVENGILTEARETNLLQE